MRSSSDGNDDSILATLVDLAATALLLRARRHLTHPSRMAVGGRTTRLLISSRRVANGCQTQVLALAAEAEREYHAVLMDEGAEFFRTVCAGRAGDELMFTNAGREWRRSEQGRPMEEAVERAKIKPPIGFHGLRHTWASLSVMGGMPLLVVAKNLGHVDTKMVEKHYGHLAPSYVAETTRQYAPRFGAGTPSNVTPLAKRRHNRKQATQT